MTPSEMSQAFFADWTVPWKTRRVLLAIVLARLFVWLASLFIGFLMGVSSVVAGFQVPSATTLNAILSRPPWIEIASVIQLMMLWACFTGFVLRPFGLRTGHLFALPVSPGADPVHVTKPQLAQDIRKGSRAFIVAFVLVIMLFVLTLFGIWLMSLQSGQSPDQNIASYLQEKQHENRIFLNQELGWTRAFLMVFIAPFVEELAFRGGLYASLRKRFGFWGSAFLAGLTFMLAHQQYRLNMPQMLVIGMTSAYVFERTRSLRASVIMHACWNLLGVLVANPAIGLWLLLAGAALLAWLLKPARGAGRLRGDSRRTGWKWYFGIFAFVLVVGYGLEPRTAWQIIAELPLLVGLWFYAWNRPAPVPECWRVLAVLYAFWVAFGLWVDSLPVSARQPWQQPFFSGEPIVTVGDLTIELCGYFFVVGPSLIATWRLGAGQSSKSSASPEPLSSQPV